MNLYERYVLRYAQLRLKEEAAPATVNRELAALRAAYRLGLDNEVITAMPRIKLLPEKNVRKGFAESKQVETVCKRLKPDVADGTRFAFLTGWRRAEVFTLTWPQVDWERRLCPARAGHDQERGGPRVPDHARAPRNPRATPGDHPPLRARPDAHHPAGLPSERPAHSVVPAVVEEGLREGRTARPALS